MITEDVRIDSAAASLAGTFIPAPDPVAAALMITGSGRLDRDSNAAMPLGRTLRFGVTRAVAEALVQARVSTLRYDKRGCGASNGDYLSAGMDQLMDDARAALDRLAERAPGLPLLVVGHSEGAYYAARLAAEQRAAGTVLLSGSVRGGEEVLLWQTENIATRLPAAVKFLLRTLRMDLVQSTRTSLYKIVASSDDVARIRGQKISGRWVRDFVAYDPAAVLGRVTSPVLAITGGQDLQVHPDDVDTVGRLVQGPFEGHVVGDLSHLLRPDPNSVGPAGYARAVREPVSSEALRLVNDWVTRHWAPTAPGHDAVAHR